MLESRCRGDLHFSPLPKCNDMDASDQPQTVPPARFERLNSTAPACSPRLTCVVTLILILSIILILTYVNS